MKTKKAIELILSLCCPVRQTLSEQVVTSSLLELELYLSKDQTW